MEKKIYLGLDVGTNSVGWCLTDENYNIIKKKGKHLWGVRLFDEAQDAKARRTYRSQRRMIRRRRERIELLNEIFAPELYKVDPTFLERLNESFFDYEDRKNKNKTTLFIDKNFTDKEYFKMYKTIFHLRSELIDSKKKEDIRLVYLAIHNIIKYRGNFLYDGFNVNEIISFNTLTKHFNDINENLKNIPFLKDVSINLDENKYTELLEIFKKNKTITDIKKGLELLFNAKEDETKILSNVIIPLLSGSVVSLKKLAIYDEVFEDSDEKILIDDSDFLMKNEDFKGIYSEYFSLFEIFDSIHTIRNDFKLYKLLGKEKSISKVMKKSYGEYQCDLRALKHYIKDHFPELKTKIFRKIDKDEKNYVKYTGFNISGTIRKNTSKCSQEEFYKYLEGLGILNHEEFSNDENYLRIKNKIASKTFLKKQRSSENSIYPYQLNEYELKLILNNQAEFYPFLKEKDDEGYSNIDKILSLLTFKRPYFIGPLADSNDPIKGKYSWAIKKEKDKKIYPWNFENMVDYDASAIRFIERMQNKCSYLLDQYCLPKNSMIYQLYNVLNFVNKINVNGSLISISDRDDLIENVFKNNKVVTRNDIMTYFKNRYGDDVSLTTTIGKSIDQIDVNMSSYFIFKNIFGEEYVKNNEDKLEEVIRDLSIFTDKSILERRLKTVYKFDQEKIKKIKNLNFHDFGRLSKKLLIGLKNSEDKSVLDYMKETNENFMEVINNHGFIQIIEKYNQELLTEDAGSVDEFIKNLNVPVMSHRAIKQSYLIIEELEKIIGRKIDKYFIEFTRSNKQEKTKKDSRYERIQNLYKSARNLLDYISESELKDLKNNLKEISEDKGKMKSEKIYLYFAQLGRSLYTGEKIDFHELLNGTTYDRDHIIPQCLIKDDSLSNKVLSEKHFNETIKKDDFLRKDLLWKDHGGYKKAYAYFKFLKDNKFISEKEYANLTKNNFTYEELNNFANRQKVVTDQSTKGLVSLLKDYIKVDPSNIIYSKGENVSDFRRNYELVKSRIANNFHHAHDAYLNIIIGDIFDQYFKWHYIINYDDLKLYKEKHITANESYLLKKEIISNFGANKKVLWDVKRDLPKIKKYLYETFDIFITRRVFEKHDLYSKVTILPKNKNLIPLKRSFPYTNTEKYGGLNNPSYSYFSLIKKNDNFILTPYTVLKDIDNDSSFILKVKINTIIKIGIKKVYLTGVSNNSLLITNDSERIFSYDLLKTINKIEKLNKIEDYKILQSLKDSSNFLKKYKYDSNSNKILLWESSKTKVYLTYDEIMNLIYDFKEKTAKEMFNFGKIKELNTRLCNQEILKKLNFTELLMLTLSLLKLLSTNENNGADLKLIGMKSHSCLLSINSKLSEDTKIIFESVTGFYSKVVREYK